MKPKNQKYSEKSIYEPAFEKYRFHFNHFVSLKVKNIYNVNSMNDSDILSSTVPDNNKRKIRIHFFNFQSYITLILSDKNIFNFQIRKSLLYRRTPAFHRRTPAFQRFKSALQRCTAAFQRCKSDIQSNRSANKIIVKDKLRYLSSFKIYAPGKYCYKVILFRITPVEKSIMNIQFVKRNFIPGSKADEFG